MMTKYIINADDFGLHPDVNQAIIDCLDSGLISDTSMIVTVLDGLEDTIQHLPALDGHVGCHLCLTAGTPLTDAMKSDSLFCDTEGLFHTSLPYGIALNRERKSNIYNEFQAQIRKIQSLGLTITHADSHQHIHHRLGILPIAVECCREFGIPYLRKPGYKKGSSIKNRLIQYMESVYIRSRRVNTVDLFGDWCQVLSCEKGFRTVEVMCHPRYNSKRIIIDKRKGVETDLCDKLEAHLTAFQNEKLVTFKNLLES